MYHEKRTLWDRPFNALSHLGQITALLVVERAAETVGQWRAYWGRVHAQVTECVWMPSSKGAWVKDVRLQVAVLSAAVVLFAVLPWFVPYSDIEAHNILHHLNFIPLMLAGMLFGWRGALIALLLAGVAHLPHLQRTWSVAHLDASDQVVELSIFGAAGLVAGLLADRERAQRAKAEKTSLELAHVYGELQSNVERMRKAERLYAAGQLSASLAHEIRNPLISISGAAGILKRGHASPTNVRECLDIIDIESRRLNKLLTNFLDFARPRTLRFQPTDLGTIVESVASVAAHASGDPSVRICHSRNGFLPEVQCDPEQLKQVLLNLVINAVQASPPGSTVTISAAPERSGISLSVHDEGCGIAEEQRQQIFDPFFTTKESGTGLGLAIASMIVSQHGGTLTANANPDRGMTFRIDLPHEARQVAV